MYIYYKLCDESHAVKKIVIRRQLLFDAINQQLQKTSDGHTDKC